MYRAHGAPEIQREDEAIDALCVRIARRRALCRRIVVVVSLAASLGVLSLAASLPSNGSMMVIGAKALGVIFALTLFACLFGGHALAARWTGRSAERWARDLAAARRCDPEPLVDAARLLSGGHG